MVAVVSLASTVRGRVAWAAQMVIIDVSASAGGESIWRRVAECSLMLQGRKLESGELAQWNDTAGAVWGVDGRRRGGLP